MDRRKRITGFQAIPIAAMGVLTAGVLSLASCSKDSTAPRAAVASVSLAGSPAGGIAIVGQTVQLTASPKDASGNALANRTVTWSSSAATVATVSAAGLVTAVSPGSATISAAVEGQAATTDLAIRAAVALPAAGATQPAVTQLSGGAGGSLSVPPGAVSAGLVLNAGPAPASSFAATPRLLAGTAFAFGPDGAQFAAPLTLQLKFDPTGLSAADKAALGIYVANGANWDRVSGSVVSNVDNSVAAPVTHFSVYAVLKRSDPAALSATAGNNQTASAGTAVAVKPTVLVADARGQPVPGITVTFSVGLGGGSVTGASTTSDANGLATVGSWTLGPVAGDNSLTATVSGINPIAFFATATAPPPPAIQLSAATAAFAYTTGNALPASQAIGITNAGVAALSDLTVDGIQFGGASSGWLTATLSSASAPATVTLALTSGASSLTVGTYSAIVQIGSLSSSNSPKTITVSLTVSATTARALAITTQPSGARSGSTFDVQPVVEVRDATGARVTSATLTITVSLASGPGTLAGTLTLAAVGGIARFTDLKVTGKGYTQLLFESGTLTSANSGTFWVADGTAAYLTALAGDGQTANISTTLPTSLVVRVTDADGIPVPGVLINWAVMNGGGSLSVTNPTTDATGKSTAVWTLGATAGGQQVSAIVTGAAGSPVTFTATGVVPPNANTQSPR